MAAKRKASKAKAASASESVNDPIEAESPGCEVPDFDDINKFFESALNTIPAAVYFASPTVQIQPGIKNNRFMHKKSGLRPSEHKLKKSGKEKCEEKPIVEIQQQAFLNDAKPDNLKERLHEKLQELSAKRKRDPSKPEKRQRNTKQKLSSAEKAEQTASKKAAKRSASEMKQQSAAKTAKADEKSSTPSAAKGSNQKASQPDITIANVDVGNRKKRDAKYVGAKKLRLEKALHRAEQEKAELEGLSPAERIAKQTQRSSKLALLKAQGVKIRNDPALIKKSLKAYESKKRHSAKKWDKRKQALKKSKESQSNVIREAIQQ